jgi:hypothetical protein|tara:strand:+ start:458 stop:799 length:342 start_codon:yes stop_codon:yes gene_type:complete
MAKYIKIRKENINITDNKNDFLIGLNNMTLIKSGKNNDTGKGGFFTIFHDDSNYITFTVPSTTGNADPATEWTEAIQKAAIGNPGAPEVVVLPIFGSKTPVKITAIEVSQETP